MQLNLWYVVEVFENTKDAIDEADCRYVAGAFSTYSRAKAEMDALQSKYKLAVVKNFVEVQTI